MTTYSDFMIGSLDQNFIENLSETFGIDWEDVEINVENPSSASITNQIIYGLFNEYINKLDNEELKEKLLDNIYTNCIDSFIQNYEDIKEEFKNKLSSEDLEILENLE